MKRNISDLLDTYMEEDVELVTIFHARVPQNR